MTLLQSGLQRLEQDLSRTKSTDSRNFLTSEGQPAPQDRKRFLPLFPSSFPLSHPVTSIKNSSVLTGWAGMTASVIPLSVHTLVPASACLSGCVQRSQMSLSVFPSPTPSHSIPPSLCLALSYKARVPTKHAGSRAPP